MLLYIKGICDEKQFGELQKADKIDQSTKSDIVKLEHSIHNNMA